MVVKGLNVFASRVLTHTQYKLRYWYNISVPQFLIALLLPKIVQHGLFKGMRYLYKSTGSVVLPKLVGTYEDEITDALLDIQSNTYDLFVDVGAAEGYYVVGIHKYIFKGHVPCVAFESTLRGQNLINKLAKINKVTEINIKGHCDKNELKQVISGRKTFILMDIEGGEKDLLDPQEIPALINNDILVELHPEAVSSIKELIVQRFHKTHSITEYERDLDKHFPDNIKIPRYLSNYKQYMLNEFRGNQSWLYLKAKLR